MLRKLNKIDSSLRYESTSRFIIEMTMALSISVFVNLFFGNPDDPINALSFLIAFGVLIVMIATLGYSIAIPLLYHHKIHTHPDKFKRHCFLFLEFKTDKIK